MQEDSPTHDLLGMIMVEIAVLVNLRVSLEEYGKMITYTAFCTFGIFRKFSK